jgi:hypothetical protein
MAAAGLLLEDTLILMGRRPGRDLAEGGQEVI